MPSFRCIPFGVNSNWAEIPGVLPQFEPLTPEMVPCTMTLSINRAMMIERWDVAAYHLPSMRLATGDFDTTVTPAGSARRAGADVRA
jgi:hypothetical protein